MLVLAVAMAPMWWWRMKVQRSPHRDNGEFHQFYVHRHQTGNNNNWSLAAAAASSCSTQLESRPHHMVFLERSMGALRITVGT